MEIDFDKIKVIYCNKIGKLSRRAKEKHEEAQKEGISRPRRKK